jgi:hypothetical protein
MASIRSLIAWKLLAESAFGTALRRGSEEGTYSLAGAGEAILALDAVDEGRVLGVEAVQPLGVLVDERAARDGR